MHLLWFFLINAGDRSVLGAIGHYDPHAHFVTSVDLDKLHKKSEATDTVFHISESYHFRRACHDSEVHVWRSAGDQRKRDVWYIEEFFPLFWNDVIRVRSRRCGKFRKHGSFLLRRFNPREIKIFEYEIMCEDLGKCLWSLIVQIFFKLYLLILFIFQLINTWGKAFVRKY